MKKKILCFLIFNVLLSTFVVGVGATSVETEENIVDELKETIDQQDEVITSAAVPTELLTEESGDNKQNSPNSGIEVSGQLLNESYASLEEAIDAINNHSDGSYLVRLSYSTIEIDSSFIIENGKNVTIQSNNSIIKQSGSGIRHFVVYGQLVLKDTVLDGNGVGGGIAVNDGELIIDNSTIQNCYNVSNGGGISANNSKVVMNDGVIQKNKTSDYGVSGGGISLTNDSTFDMIKGRISNNLSTWGGGVAVGKESNFTMFGGEISNNETYYDGEQAGGYGGGVHVYVRATFVMKGGIIKQNKSFTGGGIFIGQGSYVSGEPTDWCLFKMESGTISDNTAFLAGGGISQGYNGNVLIEDGTISKNSAPNGGGVYVNGMSMVQGADGISFVMEKGSLINNTATTGTGGAIYAAGENVINDRFTIAIGTKDKENTVNIEGNKAGTTGGGISLYNAPAQMMNTQMIKNSAGSSGGAIVLNNESDLEISKTTIGGLQKSDINTAGGSGGAIATFNKNNTLIMNESKVYGNTAQSLSKGGGGLYLGDFDSAVISKSEFIKNEATNKNGGAIYVNKNATLELQKSLLEESKAKQEGGGIYTENFVDYNTLTENDYQNLKIDGETIFNKNKASQAYKPPIIATSYQNIQYSKTSLIDKEGLSIHPINNYDINYAGAQILEQYYKITYYPNGGDGEVKSENLLENTNYSILSYQDTSINYTKDGYEFVEWNTKADGSGTVYQASDLYKVTEDLNLYAQWKAIVEPEIPEDPKEPEIPEVPEEPKEPENPKDPTPIVPEETKKPDVSKDETVKGEQVNIVKTSDNNNIFMYIIIMGCGFLGIAYFKRKKISNNNH